VGFHDLIWRKLIMADNLSKGLTEKSGFDATKAGPPMVESKPHRMKQNVSSAGKKGGKSFKFC
jgi:hypothetical protein